MFKICRWRARTGSDLNRGEHLVRKTRLTNRRTCFVLGHPCLQDTKKGSSCWLSYNTRLVGPCDRNIMEAKLGVQTQFGTGDARGSTAFRDQILSPAAYYGNGMTGGHVQSSTTALDV